MINSSNHHYLLYDIAILKGATKHRLSGTMVNSDDDDDDKGSKIHKNANNRRIAEKGKFCDDAEIT